MVQQGVGGSWCIYNYNYSCYSWSNTSGFVGIWFFFERGGSWYPGWIQRQQKPHLLLILPGYRRRQRRQQKRLVAQNECTTPPKKYPVLSSAAETKQPMGFPTCRLCGKPLWYRIQSHQSPFGCRHVMCHTCARVECPVCTWSVSVKRELSTRPPPQPPHHF